MEEKRRFTRIIFSTPAKLQIDGELYDTSLIDLSLQGALIANKNTFPAKEGEKCSLFFKLAGSDVTIEMMGELTHVEATQVGMKCVQIDLESVSHLKRLIALNVGSEQLLDRELAHLSTPEE